MTPPIGATLGGHYLLIRIVAQSERSITYLAADQPLGLPVKVKVLKDVSADDILVRAKHVAQLRHRSVARVLGVGDYHGLAFIASEWIVGDALPDFLARREQVSERHAVMALLPVVEALAEAHAKGIVHEHLLPGNLIVSGDTGSPTVKISDFVGGRTTLHSHDLDVATRHSPLEPSVYSAPEQSSPDRFGAVGPWSDVYAVGLAITELVVGGPRFEREALPLRAETPATPQRLGVQVSDLFERICANCLALSPKDRFQSASALLDAVLETGSRGSSSKVRARYFRSRLVETTNAEAASIAHRSTSDEPQDPGSAKDDGSRPPGQRPSSKRGNTRRWSTQRIATASVISAVALAVYLLRPASPPSPHATLDAARGGETTEYVVYDSTAYDRLPPQCHLPSYVGSRLTELLTSLGCVQRVDEARWSFVCKHAGASLDLFLIPRQIPDRLQGLKLSVQWRGSTAHLARKLIAAHVSNDIAACRIDVTRIAPIDVAAVDIVYRYPGQSNCSARACPSYCTNAENALEELRRSAEAAQCQAYDRDGRLGVECALDSGPCTKVLSADLWVTPTGGTAFQVEYAGASSQACGGEWFGTASGDGPNFGLGMPDFVRAVVDRCNGPRELFAVVDLSGSMIDHLPTYPQTIISAMGVGRRATVVGFADTASASTGIDLSVRAVQEALADIHERNQKRCMRLSLCGGSNIAAAFSEVLRVSQGPAEVHIFTDGLVEGMTPEWGAWLTRGEIRAYTWRQDPGVPEDSAGFAAFVQSSGGAVVSWRGEWPREKSRHR
jgi:serine/threonine protein kinase